jgi:DNA processing protein
MAFEIARDLARSGVAIVSGGAIGADSAAHRGAIKAGGQTVAVLACGIDFHYLMQNASLRYEISQNGALISEYPPGYPVQNFNFPVRNRLISALSPGTVVIEASKRSGAIITANFAVEQNRDVFVIPVPKESPLSEGIFPLIDDGAKVITSAGDIMYSIFKTNRIFENNIRQNKKNINHETASTLNFKNQDNNTNTNKNKLKNLSKELIVILNIIKKGKIHIDEIKIKTSFPTKQILAGLTKLEILGLVRSLPGRFYNLS